MIKKLVGSRMKVVIIVVKIAEIVGIHIKLVKRIIR